MSRRLMSHAEVWLIGSIVILSVLVWLVLMYRLEVGDMAHWQRKLNDRLTSDEQERR